MNPEVAADISEESATDSGQIEKRYDMSEKINISSVENRPCAPGVRPDVLNYDDIVKMVPALANHRKFVEKVLHWVGIDEVNAVHGRHCYSTGVEFSRHLVEDEFKFKLRIDNEEILSRFPEEPFITVSNHPYGGMDGILLLHLVGKYRKDYQVMVNMFLNHISAMRPSFIAVDPIKTDDPEKKAVTMQGIRRAMAHVKEGHPLGFFPAGAVSKINGSLHIRDREWQPTITRLIRQLKVPVIPIYFHGHNSAFFNILGLIDWRLRSARLPKEIFNKRGKEVRVSIGEPVSVATQSDFADAEALGRHLRDCTYALSCVGAPAVPSLEKKPG